jgi:hypothetical protein
VLAVLTAALIGGQVTASAAAPAQEQDDPDLSASAGDRLPSPYNEPTIELVNTGMYYSGDQTEAACARVQGSRDTETDIVMEWNCADAGEGWRQWDINFVRYNAAGTPLYEFRNPHTDLCLSLEGVESGAVDDPNNGADAQQEPCERQHDALWWFRIEGGSVLVRPYLKNSAGRYPCLEADAWDDIGAKQVQVWDCSSSDLREWDIVLRDSSNHIWPPWT